MTMANTLTDQLDLVKREDAKGRFRLFSRRLGASDGFCLVVFRKEDYVGAILSEDVITENDLKRRYDRLGVRDGDSILRVNMGPRPFTIKDVLLTLDGYVRSYELQLEIAVTDARNFAQRYRQASDPVNMARIAIEGYLRSRTARKNHDDLSESMLRDYAEDALRVGSNGSFGISVVAAHKVTLWQDPLRAKELEIAQKTHIKKVETLAAGEVGEVEIQTKATLDYKTMELAQRQQAAAAAYERIEEDKRKRHEMETEAYLLIQKNKHRSITRVDEVDELDHTLALERTEHDHARLEAGKEKAAVREEQKRQDEYDAQRGLLRIEARRKERWLTRVDEVDELEHKQWIEARLNAVERGELLLAKVSSEAIEALSGVISDKIESRQKLSEVFSEYPELTDLFGVPRRKQLQLEEKQTPAAAEEANASSPPTEQAPSPATSSAQSPTAAETVGESAALPDSAQQEANEKKQGAKNLSDTSSLPGILRQQDDTIDITDLGMTLSRIELSPQQHEIAATSSTTAFVIQAVRSAGPAQHAEMVVGDIIVEINGKEAGDAQDISGILKAYKPGMPVVLCFLRGEEWMSRTL